MTFTDCRLANLDVLRSLGQLPNLHSLELGLFEFAAGLLMPLHALSGLLSFCLNVTSEAPPSEVDSQSVLALTQLTLLHLLGSASGILGLHTGGEEIGAHPPACLQWLLCRQ